MVKRVQILRPRVISVVQKNLHSPSLSSKKHRSVKKKKIKHQKVVNEMLQSNHLKMQSVFYTKIGQLFPHLFQTLSLLLPQKLSIT